MKPIEQMQLHPQSEKLIEVLCQKTQNQNDMFFRVLVAYYFGMMAAQMRVSVKGFDKGNIPLNVYAINLSPSGTGKGYATSFMENHVLGKFKDIFTNYTFLQQADMTMDKYALGRSIRNGTSTAEAKEELVKEFDLVGPFLFNFDSGTVPAVKQHRHKVLLAGCGSLNYQVDEIGANLTNQLDVLYAFLELYDLGLLKEKLIKSTVDNKRLEKIEGPTPANMLLFGSTSKMMDGGRTEESFMDLLEMGYARRCIVAYETQSAPAPTKTAKEILADMFDTTTSDYIEQISDEFALLADINNVGKKIYLPQDVLLELIEYRLICQRKAVHYSQQENIKKAEMEHRYFKALKMAGIYAFIEDCSEISSTHLENAIALIEMSGASFQKLLIPEKNYMKLAKYLAEAPTDLTLADLDQELPYFKGTKPQKDEMISLAIAHGYRNNIIIRKSIVDSIAFYSGESLQETDLEELLITISEDYATDYEAQVVPFEDLINLGLSSKHHWSNHSYVDDHRRESNVLPGFNMIVLDVDSGYPLKAALKTFEGINAFFYTTKRHKTTDAEGIYLGERYRIVIPTNYILYLDSQEYKEFMNNIIAELPFEIDDASNQRSKKWETFTGETHYTRGKTFDVLPFIPETKRSDERKSQLEEQDLDKLESWFMNNIGDGNRNKQLYRYACILMDTGHNFVSIQEKVLSFNAKLIDGLSVDELSQTVLKSIAQKVN